jgi:hypothetical protein
MVPISVHDGKTVTVVFKALDDQQKPGIESTPPTYSIDDTSIAVVGNVSADGFTVDVTGVSPGTFTLTAHGTNPAGSFFTPFAGCQVLGGNATSFAIASIGPEH